MGKNTRLRLCSENAAQEIAETRRRIELNAAALRGKASAKELLRPLTSRLSHTLGEGGNKILEAFRDNPVPLTLVGVGLGWLLLRDFRGASSGTAEASGPGLGEKDKEAVHDAADGAKEAAQKVGDVASEAAGKVSDKVSHAAGKVKDVAKKGVDRTSDWFARTLDENPLVLAVGTLAAGIVAGLSLPVTEKEVETAGAVGEKLAAAALDKGTAAVEASGQPSEEAQRMGASEEHPSDSKNAPGLEMES